MNLDRSALNYHTLPHENHLICILNSDENHLDACVSLRDRLQEELGCNVEMIGTSSCQSLDLFIDLIDRASLCIYCLTTRMKTDNLSHFVQRYMSLQANPVPLLSILIEKECEIDGCWLETISNVTNSSIIEQISHYFIRVDTEEVRLPSRISDSSSFNRMNTITPDEGRNQSRNYLNRPVPNWSTEDVSEWCEATQGNFESLQPLVMRLNGSGLVNLAEILSIEPASMYHSLNDELLQRTGTSVPITEYVSLRSELQQLLVQKQNLSMPEIVLPSPRLESTTNNTYKKKRWKNSRLCSIL